MPSKKWKKIMTYLFVPVDFVLLDILVQNTFQISSNRLHTQKGIPQYNLDGRYFRSGHLEMMISEKGKPVSVRISFISSVK